MKNYSGIFLIFLCIALVFFAGCTSQKAPATSNLVPTTTFTTTPTPMPITTTMTIPAAVSTTTNVTLSLSTSSDTQAKISESALNARIQDAENKLDPVKETHRAGYLIDVNTGEMRFVEGGACAIISTSEDTWRSCAINDFKASMDKGHTYILLYTNPAGWSPSPTITAKYVFKTFSLADLAAVSNLTEQGYHIQKMIAVSDRIYEIYPRTSDKWKTKAELSIAVDQIEKTMDVQYHTDTVIRNTSQTFTLYDVDKFMPQLIKKIDYTYIINKNVII